MTIPSSAQRTLRIAGWAAWQLVCLFFAFVVWANLFSEYGIYSNKNASAVTAMALLVFAVWIGTWVPVRKWLARREASSLTGRRP
jgi:hypothetical protein